MKTIVRTRISDGGALDLATSILALAYDVKDRSADPGALATLLGLGDVKAHTVETSFSYPNGVAVLRDERGRSSLYLFDSDQEFLKEGETLRDIDPATPVSVAVAESGDTPAEGARKTGASRLEDYSQVRSADLRKGDGAIEATPVPDTPVAVPVKTAADDAAPAGIGEAMALDKAQPVDPAPAARVEDAPAAAVVDDPVPGLTPGHPVDALTGKPIDLDDAERQRLAQVKIDDPAPASIDSDGREREVQTIGQNDLATVSDVLGETLKPAIGVGVDTDTKSSTDATGDQPKNSDLTVTGEPVDRDGSNLTPEMRSAWEEGSMAYTTGGSLDDNPYPLGQMEPKSDRARAWIAGFEWRPI